MGRTKKELKEQNLSEKQVAGEGAAPEDETLSSTFSGMISTAVTLLCWARSTDMLRPTYPVPATAMFMVVLCFVVSWFVSGYSVFSGIGFRSWRVSRPIFRGCC